MPTDVGTLPASAAPSSAASGQASVDLESALLVQTGDGEKQKKGHRRGRSLTGLIPTLKTKPKRSQSQLLEVICYTCTPNPCSLLLSPAAHSCPLLFTPLLCIPTCSMVLQALE